MQRIISINALVIVGLLIFACGYEAPFQAGEPIFVAEGNNPVWSATGSMLAFVRAGSLFVADAPEFAAPKLITTEANEWFYWVGDTGFVWIARTGNDDSTQTAYIIYSDMLGQIKVYATDTVEYRQNRFFGFQRLMSAPDGNLRWELRTRPEKHHDTSRMVCQPLIRYRSYAASRSHKVLFKPLWGTKNVNTTHILMAEWDGADARIIISGSFKWPYPFFAPDQRHIAIWNTDDEIIIMDTLGNLYTKSSPIKGRIWDWSSDSKYILYSTGRTRSDTVLDLFAFDWQQNRHIRITDSPEVGEFAPSFSADGKFITYFITRQWKCGRVFVVPLYPQK